MEADAEELMQARLHQPCDGMRYDLDEMRRDEVEMMVFGSVAYRWKSNESSITLVLHVGLRRGDCR